jgi:hypothetical protein
MRARAKLPARISGVSMEFSVIDGKWADPSLEALAAIARAGRMLHRAACLLIAACLLMAVAGTILTVVTLVYLTRLGA